MSVGNGPRVSGMSEGCCVSDVRDLYRLSGMYPVRTF